MRDVIYSAVHGQWTATFPEDFDHFLHSQHLQQRQSCGINAVSGNMLMNEGERTREQYWVTLYCRTTGPLMTSTSIGDGHKLLSAHRETRRD